MSNFDDIKKFLRFIKLYPKTSNVFYQERELDIVIDGKMLPMKSDRCIELSKFDEFYLYVSVEARDVKFLAFSPDRDSSEQGTLEWDSIEMSLATFFVANMDRLTSSSISSAAPVYKASSTSTATSGVKSRIGYDEENFDNFYKHPAYGMLGHHQSYTPAAGYTDADYKEREKINEQLRTILKTHRMGRAIDFIIDKMKFLCDEDKFESLNALFLSLPADMMTIPVMMEVLRTSRGADHLCSNRGTFFSKVKDRLAKTKNAKLIGTLMTLEPGKEYPGIPKMERAPKKEETANATGG